MPELKAFVVGENPCDVDQPDQMSVAYLVFAECEDQALSLWDLGLTRVEREAIIADSKIANPLDRVEDFMVMRADYADSLVNGKARVAGDALKYLRPFGWCAEGEEKSCCDCCDEYKMRVCPACQMCPGCADREFKNDRCDICDRGSGETKEAI